MNTERIGKEELLDRINQLSFAVNEMVLYLDTHPCDEEAIAYFEEKSAQRDEALELYARCYGPLTVDTANDVSLRCWEWVNQPWPWETRKGGCR